MHLYKDDHIKDVRSTCRGSCNTRMECWWQSTSSTSVALIFYISLSVLYTVGAKQGIFVLPFFLAVLLWSRQTCPKNECNLFHWFTAASRLEPAVCQHGSNQSVCPFFHQHCVCVLFVLFYSALPLFESTVAPGQSLGVGKREGGVSWSLGVPHKHTAVQDDWHSEDCERVCGRGSFLLGSASHHPHQTHQI